MSTTPAPVPPQLIPQLMWAFAGSSILAAAIELDIGTAIHDGHRTAEAVARERGCSWRGTAPLLDALTGFGLLEKNGREYRLTPESETYLVQSSPYYLGPMIDMSRELAQRYTTLADAVRTGKPMIAVEQESQGPEFFGRLVQGLFALNYPTGRFVADHRLLGPVGEVLDVAVGSGAWSIPLAEVDPEVRVTGLDFAEVLPVTRQFFQRRHVAKQFDEMPGNLRDIDFGSERFDLVILGHILHSEGEASGRELLKKTYRALKPGGTVLIAEFIPNDDRTAPPQPLVFTLNMLLHTTEGTTFTMPELREMLTAAGFGSIRTLDAPAASPLVAAQRPD